MLGQQKTMGGREKVPKELNLGHCELPLGQSNHQPMLLTEEKNFTEVFNMRRQIPAEDEDIVHIHATEQ